MTVLFSGSFAENLGVADYHSTAATGRDATMTDAQVALPQIAETSIGWGGMNISSASDLWFHWRMHATETGNVNDNTVADLFQVTKANGSGPFTIRKSSPSSDRTFNARIPTTDGASVELLGGTTYTFDVCCRFSSGSQIIEWYINGSLASTVSRTETASNYTSFKITNTIGRRATGSNPVYLSEFIMATASTIGARVQTLRPSSAGTYAQWTGSPGSVNDFNPVTGITASTSGLIASRVHTAALSGTIRSVQPWGYQVGLAPPRSSPMFRIAGTDYFTASPVTPGANSAHPNIVTSNFATNPATSAAWTTSDLAGIDGGFRSEVA